MVLILVGTASWTDPTLLSSGWYPAEAQDPESRLRYYAAHFPLVEIDSSYYALPRRENAKRWAERTPAGFTFDCKAFRLFTQHPASPAALPSDLRPSPGREIREKIYYRDLPEAARRELWRRFREGLSPLRGAGKLGVVLFQFPPWFSYSQENREHLLHCAAMLEGYRIAVEFRNASWFSGARRADETLQWESEQGFIPVIVDEPQGTSASVAAIWEVPWSEVAVVRLHGRNRETWMARNLHSAADRFRYRYDDAELRELAASVRALRVSRIHVLFNNCYRDYGVRNAARFQEILTGMGS
ncbi:hypothetical protein MAMC_00405 [Methylacidimicrobium cyclopophantes]|uniref:DUF72 domain-containing protein n=1 Tax=Methylacidimicrobium cyclopophantes TaxID=1041766 RepID=A0A5E6M6B5_9BACT|nr:DUF72 domain-containing protein [Methylacidimicrobium cyclopophantes]VVM05094.1 hypothetical protein MAMC_00405 [Methylacidimicrobium cyclopophantes]